LKRYQARNPIHLCYLHQISYGDYIEILGIDDKIIFLKINEININPSVGDKE